MATVRLTMAQALVRHLAAQKTEIDGKILPLFAGMWAIFGHGNVAGLGEALSQARDQLPTYRAHNEQAMAHAAIAFAKASSRRRMMACTTSIGPGATNMITAAAVAHVNRLPVLLLPGDVFANRRPDPVLQQVEDFNDGTVSANDCFRPVSRYFDRITRPEQIINALPRAIAVLTDPAECGPVVLALCQDVQAEACSYPGSFFTPRIWQLRRPQPDTVELERAIKTLQAATAPIIIAGGGVHYSQATHALRRFAEAHGIPASETQAGKSALPHDHALNMGAIGVTGTAAANALAEKADVILAIGTRLQDFTTGSWALFNNPARVILGVNVQAFDAGKHGAMPMVCDARIGIEALDKSLQGWKVPQPWIDRAHELKAQWLASTSQVTAATNALPSDAQVIGAVQRSSRAKDVIVCAAGGLPGELHKLWRASEPGSYHLEYGYSCMGYEIAGGLGVKMASPDREVIVMVGDGSYLMMNSEIATSIMLGLKLTIVVLDNGGFGCINRLQVATGGEPFNNLFESSKHRISLRVDFAKTAEGLGAASRHVNSIAELETALAEARNSLRTTVIVIDADPLKSTDAGGHWWDVPVPEVSSRAEVDAARASYVEGRKQQRLGD
jgi:3D-(3,5/4)-trihydroxycyclohexane-1,2-dione acylhydrolase (decyclizing)